MDTLLYSFVIAALVFAVHVVTNITITPYLGLQLFYIFVFILLVYIYFTENAKSITFSTRVISLLIAGSIISLVGSTGWFVSPFSFLLYILTVCLTLFFPALVSLIFVLSLLILSIVITDEKNITLTFLTILSLIASVPISIYIRGVYLRFKESEKTILILKRTHKRYKNRVEEVLDNVVHRFATDIRTEIGIIRQLSSQLVKEKDTVKRQKIYHLLNTSVNRALQILLHFEEQATGSKMITQPHEFESKKEILQKK